MKRPAVIAAVVLAVLAAVAAVGVLLLPRGGGLPVTREMASFRVAGAAGIVQVDLQRVLHCPWAAASLAEIERRQGFGVGLRGRTTACRCDAAG